ncbi:uncharacterized protein LOC134535917 [Bacillus rossius redtenbacheri]|uniref:uncharacterized protein LOC134535917 n=1 Tax=Bacillus rossius redtenbacheri TaxID=93214 RepID=UPI002FDCE663
MEEERRKSTPATPPGHRGSFKNGSAAAKRNSLRCSRGASLELEDEDCGPPQPPQPPRVPHKFIANWRSACDRTRDKTKELLKRWRTLPEGGAEPLSHPGEDCKDAHSHGGWSVHVWSTWVRRFPSEDEEAAERGAKEKDSLSPLQRLKLTHFFSHLLDWDKDELISAQDFEAVSERLRHFADWSDSSAEFHALKEVERGFVDAFARAGRASHGELAAYVEGMASLDEWLRRWGELLGRASGLADLPLWLQFFCKVVFAVINRSGSGVITRDELRVFYSSFLGFDVQRVGEVLDIAYNNMTSNGDHQLRFHVYQLCFANFLLGRNPHGPGQLLFGPFEGCPPHSTAFPVDYSALNCPADKLEQYSPHRRSNRLSVIV